MALFSARFYSQGLKLALILHELHGNGGISSELRPPSPPRYWFCVCALCNYQCEPVRVTSWINDVVGMLKEESIDSSPPMTVIFNSTALSYLTMCHDLLWCLNHSVSFLLQLFCFWVSTTMWNVRNTKLGSVSGRCHCCQFNKHWSAWRKEMSPLGLMTNVFLHPDVVSVSHVCEAGGRVRMLIVQFLRKAQGQAHSRRCAAEPRFSRLFCGNQVCKSAHIHIGGVWNLKILFMSNWQPLIINYLCDGQVYVSCTTVRDESWQ